MSDRQFNVFSHSRASSLTVYRLVCADTVEENILKVSSLLPRTMATEKAELGSDLPSEDNNGILWGVKRKMLESLIGVKLKGVDDFGDNGIKREELLFPDDRESEKVGRMPRFLDDNSNFIDIASSQRYLFFRTETKN